MRARMRLTRTLFPMTQSLAEILTYAVEARAALLAAVADVPDTLVHQRPAEGRWSVAETLDHLRRVEKGIVRTIVKAVGKPEEPRTLGGATRGGLPFDATTASPRLEAPPAVQPTAGVDPAVSIEALRQSREELLHVLRAAAGRDLTGITATSPILGELDVHQWVEFDAQHEVRHTRQIQATLEALGPTLVGATDTRRVFRVAENPVGVRRLTLLEALLAVCRLEASTPVPEWALASPRFLAITRAGTELSIVCEQSHVPDGVRCERDYRAFVVSGPLDFSLVGVLASLARPLADAAVPVLSISTFDTDYLLVRQRDANAATEALRRAGHTVA
jgi:uncharacterized damage-inducible protein DinB